jgi:hypothetical protein
VSFSAMTVSNSVSSPSNSHPSLNSPSHHEVSAPSCNNSPPPPFPHHHHSRGVLRAGGWRLPLPEPSEKLADLCSTNQSSPPRTATPLLCCTVWCGTKQSALRSRLNVQVAIIVCSWLQCPLKPVNIFTPPAQTHHPIFIQRPSFSRHPCNHYPQHPLTPHFHPPHHQVAKSRRKREPAEEIHVAWKGGLAQQRAAVEAAQRAATEAAKAFGR